MDLHLIKDEIVERLIATHTCLAADDRLKGRDLEFVEANYLPFDHKMRIAGQHLHPAAATGWAPFRIAIKARYALITPHGPPGRNTRRQTMLGEMFTSIPAPTNSCAPTLRANRISSCGPRHSSVAFSRSLRPSPKTHPQGKAANDTMTGGTVPMDSSRAPTETPHT